MVAANRAGERLLGELVAAHGREAVEVSMRQLQEAAAGKVAHEIAKLPGGEHRFEDRLDDGTPIRVRLAVAGERMLVDFTGTGGALRGNLNAPRAVVQAALLYVLRALVAERIPLNGGCLAPVELRIPPGSLLDPPPGSAVAGGNVETSQRVVDVLLGALGRVAASQGTMNNVAFGNERFAYYETLGGGAGAGEGFDGASGVHVHMTNTRITDAEILETRYPVRLRCFALRRGSGGRGRWTGGDGLVRVYEFLEPMTVSLLAERRVVPPYGMGGGAPGATGRDRLERADGSVLALPGKLTFDVRPGDVLRIETPGGGGFGRPATEPRSLASERSGVYRGTVPGDGDGGA
jgi:5-oxoprolinase (ATP-hydrolysing)